MYQEVGPIIPQPRFIPLVLVLLRYKSTSVDYLPTYASSIRTSYIVYHGSSIGRGLFSEGAMNREPSEYQSRFPEHKYLPPYLPP